MSNRADRFTVVIDTDVLVGALVRNIVLSLAEAGFFRPRWSSTTIDEEFERAFARMYPGQEEIGAKHRASIEGAFPEARVSVDERLIGRLDLPDADDWHVLATAIQIKAALIITNNVRDFPAERLAPHEVEALSADDFVADCIDLAGPEAVVVLRGMRERFNRPEMDADALILRMEQVGLTQAAALLMPFKGSL